jgi:hypothetical protein
MEKEMQKKKAQKILALSRIRMKGLNLTNH